MFPYVPFVLSGLLIRTSLFTNPLFQRVNQLAMKTVQVINSEKKRDLYSRLVIPMTNIGLLQASEMTFNFDIL
jgi:hypothetical protein